MTATTRELFERYHAGWQDRAPDRIAALHTADSLFHLHASQEPACGRPAIRAAVVELLALVPDLTFDLISLRVGADFWAARFEVTGTTAAGRPLRMDLADFVLVEGGAVKEKHSYVDGIAMQAALAPVP